MSKDSIRLSEKHGVNPSLEQCFICGKDARVLLFGQLEEDAEAPRRVCFGPNSEPCNECKNMMEMGIILISVRDGEEGKKNPYRTGGFAVVREEAIKRWDLPSELEAHILRRRVAFIPDEVWKIMGIPQAQEDGS